MDAAYDRWWRHNPLDNKRCHLEKRGHEHEDTTQAIPIENLSNAGIIAISKANQAFYYDMKIIYCFYSWSLGRWWSWACSGPGSDFP